MTRIPAKRYTDFLCSHDPSQPVLPAMHTCFGISFLRILDSRKIESVKFDEVISQKASFFFYGKPSYRPKSDGSFNGTMRSALFCFVLDYMKLPLFSGALPFDSGGYKKFYKEICAGAELGEFFMPLDAASPGRLISAFFSNNANYYKGVARTGVAERTSKLDFHSQGLGGIYAGGRSTKYDQRSHSIELHYTQTIFLTPDNVLAIAGPEEACESDELIKAAGELGAKLIPYELDLDDVNSRQRQIRDAVQKWLQASGYFNG